MSRPLLTKVSFDEPQHKVSLDSGVLFIGSCFAEKKGQRLLDLRFPALVVNPFGITYNPLSVSEQLSAMSAEAKPSLSLFEHEGLWHSWAHHGRFSHPDKTMVERMVEEEFDRGRSMLMKAQHIFLTLGTAWTYHTLADGRLVNNRHKMPSRLFSEKRLADPVEIIDGLAAAIQGISDFEQKTITLSVSPIRHWKDGAVDNGASKGALLYACHRLADMMPSVTYLPAYEVVMDELRDYRFYAEDMLHPSRLTEDLLWERFIEAYFDGQAQEFISEMEAYKKMKAHRILHPDTEEARFFSEKLEGRERELMEKYGFLKGGILK